MSNNFNIDVKVFEQRTNLNDFSGFNSSGQTGLTAADLANQASSEIAALQADFAARFGQPTGTNSNTNGAFANINNLFANPNLAQPQVENYGGFQFKNAGEQNKVDQALAELRQQQAANPGQKVSKKIKVGKYKLTITLNEDGSVHIKRKKKKGGLFGGIGNFFKKVGNVLKKALPIISTVAMFIPGLQPLALAARVASGVMGVVDGIKNGNIFGAITSAVGAFSGVGGKVGSFFSGIGNKASGLMNSIGGAGSSWFSKAVGTASSLFSKGSSMWSNFTSGIGSKVSSFFSSNGSSLIGNLAKSFGGNVGNWLTQNGSSLVSKFSDMMGNRAVNWLNEKASNVLSRVMNNPLGQKINNFLNSGWGQMVMEFFKGRQA